MSARSRRLDRSLGSSWSDAEFTSDDEGGSIFTGSDTGSEVELEESDREVAQQPDPASIVTPRPKRDHLRQPTPTAQQHSTPSRKQASQIRVNQPQKRGSDSVTPRPYKRDPRTPKPDASGPAFIMPSMENASGYDGSPMSKSQPRNRARNTAQNRSSNSRRTSARSSIHGSLDDHGSSRQSQEEVSPWHYVNLFWENVGAPLFAHFMDIFSYAIRHFVKPFLGVVMGVGILVFGIQLASGMLRFTVSNAVLGPVCALPGSSYLIPACATGDLFAAHEADFEELVNVQSKFEDILDASKDTSALPSTIKNSELAIRDLRILVKHSRLPSRKALENEFEYFVQTANEASVDLSRYNSRIGAAMDRVIATNTWTMNVLTGISEQEASVGAISKIFSHITSAFIAPPPTLQERIFDQYVLHVSKNKDEITRLIETAHALLLVLNNLEERLTTIFDIATNDDQTITRSQEELLSSLWTKLGGNRGDVTANKRSLTLLSNISGYRQRAVVHVSETLLKLQEIQAGLENLREGVAAPEMLGFKSGVPIEVHIDTIGKGVERLQVSRGEQLRAEGDTHRRLMRGHDEGDGRRELPGPAVTVRRQ